MRLIKLEDPNVLPAGTGYGCAFSPDNTYLAVAHGSSPYVTIYERNNDTFTKLSNPLTLPAGMGKGCSFACTQEGTYLAITHQTLPCLILYKLDGGVSTKLNDPLVLPTGSPANECSFTADGTYLAVAHNISPCLMIYKRTGDTFTKLNDPDVLPVGMGLGCSFTLDGAYLAVGHDYAPHITIYKKDEDSFIKLENPESLPISPVNSCSFTGDGVYLAVGQIHSPYLTIYKRTGDVFSKLNLQGVLPTSRVNSCSFTSDGVYIAIALEDSPSLIVYERNGDIFTKVSDPEILPPPRAHGCSFAENGAFLAVGHLGSPYITIYKDRPPQTVTGSITFHGHATATFGTPAKKATGSITFRGHSSMVLSAIKTAVGSITFRGRSTMELIGLVLRELEGVYQIPSSEIFSRNQPILSEDLANYIEVWINPMVPATTAEEIYRSKEAESIPAGETKIFSVEFDEEPVIEAAATLENAGANLSIITNETKYYGSTAEIAVYNSSSSEQTCIIVVTGKPLEVQGRRKIVVKDEESILDHGLVKYEFDSPLVQDEASALDIGQKILRLFSVARANIEITWRGDPAQELADICQIPEFEKLGVTKKENFYITRQQFVVADGGMNVSMAGRKVPPKEE